jgi:hypothetical protein
MFRHLAISRHGNLIRNRGTTTTKGSQSGVPSALLIGNSSAETTRKITHHIRKRIRDCSRVSVSGNNVFIMVLYDA